MSEPHSLRTQAQAIDELLKELDSFLRQRLSQGWVDAIARGDEDALATSRSGFDGRAFVQILGEAGWIVPHWPVEYGGKGVPLEAATQIAERLDYWRVPRTPHGSGLILAAPAILAHGSEETKRRLLPPMASGAERWCQLFSEPGAGSDLAGLSTRAVQDGDEWVVKGQKVWTTLGHQAEMGILLARTDPDQPKHKGITYFAIDLRSPGVDIRPLRQMTGESEFSEIFLTDVRIPDVFRIGARGEGWAASLTTLGAERVALSGSKTRRKKSKDITGGKTISEVLALAAEIPMEDRRQWRDRIVQEYIIARVVEMTAARRGIHGSLTKILNATSNQGLQVLAVDLLGARATAWRPENAEEPGFLREFLRTRANSIEGGTSEINRNIVGEHVLGLPREPDPHKGARWKDIPRS